VLVHGLFRAAWCWDQGLMERLAAEGFSCYALSLRGQGGSDVPSGLAEGQGVPLAHNVADLAEFVASLGAAPVLVGHSLGGFFVQVGGRGWLAGWRARALPPLLLLLGRLPLAAARWGAGCRAAARP
jgi:pimeloyl-ACP methyl ester carboxylesterase